ncbi:hypothetical protein AWN76_014405 [Rhodothermaceae bacterium RA]|nr:hypothetical protein AWN76_014405 [Rhodothermaceae bacterium RA]
MLAFRLHLLTALLLAAPAAAQNLPWSADFEDGSLEGWTPRDDTYFGAPIRSGPGWWTVEDGVLRQTSNIWVGDPPLEFEIHLGTHIAAGNPAWTDYALNVDVRSDDNDGIGVVFRYQDPLNYYRLMLVDDAVNGGPVQKLERRRDGRITVLAEDRSGPAYPSGWFTLTVDVRGDSIRAYQNGTLRFAVQDTSAAALTSGRIGMAVYANTGAHFDHVAVTAEAVVRTAPAPPPPTVRTPYLQQATPTSILIAWQTATETTGTVEYGPTRDLGFRVETGAPAYRHAVTLDGLTPNTTYYYRVLSGSEVFYPITPFRTAKTRAEPRLRMLVFGDSGTDTPPQHAIAALMTEKAHADFGIHVGDVSQYSGEEYDRIFFRPYADLVSRTPIYPSIGNHDTYYDDAATYLDVFYLPHNNPQQTERYYSFDYGPVHAIALDTNIGFTPGTPQYEWFVSDLQSAAAREATWRFVYFHHPPYCQAWSGWAGELNVRRHLMPLFEQYGVDVVFNGHTHAYERGSLNGVTYVITGGGGGGLDDYGRDVPHIDVTVLAHHYTLVEIDGPVLELAAFGTDATEIDRFVLTKTGTAAEPEAGGPDDAFALTALYPNPLGAGVPLTLTFQVPAPTPVTVTLYDALGRRLAPLADATYPAGTHTLSWTPPAHLAAGLYLLRLQHGTETSVRPVMLAR